MITGISDVAVTEAIFVDPSTDVGVVVTLLKGVKVDRKSEVSPVWKTVSDCSC